jgi:hypothetical protein
MPFSNKSNNRLTPANTRAVDVAKQAIKDLAPIQQRKYANAFEVQGYESVIYTRLTAGTPCSCSGHRSAIATLLDAEGKMGEGTINQVLTGMEFRVNRYGLMPQNRADKRVERQAVTADDEGDEFDAPKQEPLLPGARRLVNADYRAIDLDDDVANILGDEGEAINGRVRAQTLDDMVGDFDTDLALNDSSCLVCYGSGFVGGYSVLGGWRECLSTQWPGVDVSGTIEANQTPHSFFATEVEFTVVLPKGFVYLDCFRVMNKEDQIVPDEVTIDDLPYSVELFAALCDGLPHTIKVTFEDMTYWTHLEVQVCQTRHPALIEFPKLVQGSDLSRLNPTEDVSLNGSPLIPHMSRYDVVVESTFGQPFLITNATFWNDANRNVHGWDCNARVIQSSELLALLPRRRKLSQRPTNLVRNNVSGTNRT